MSEKSVKKPVVNRKSVLWQTLFVIAMLLVMRYLWTHSRPEPLGITDIPSENALIVGDDLYGVTGRGSRSGGMAVEVTSVSSGQKREIAAESADILFSSLPQLSIAGGNLYYAVYPRPKNTSFMGGVPAGGSGRVQKFLGTFLRSPQKAPDTVMRRLPVPTKGVFSSAGQEIRIRQASLQGGAPRDVMTLHCGTTCLLRSHLFWIRLGADESFNVTLLHQKGTVTYWTEVTPHCDVMETSLTDGTTRCIRSGVPLDTHLHLEEEGVSWQEPALYPNPPALCYAREDGSVRSLGALEKGMDRYRPSNEKWIAESGDRIYWQDVFSIAPEMNAGYTYKLMSARLDGTDRKEICSQWRGRPIEFLMLHSYQGALYACVGGAPEMVQGKPARTMMICRVHPERTDPLEVVRTVPEGFGARMFNGNMLYLSHQYKHRSFWANLTNDDAGVVYKSALYRIPFSQ